MPKAVYQGTVIAQSDDTVMLEGNHYFPPDSVVRDQVRDSDHTSVCPHKGTAKYYDVVVDDNVNPAAAWYYDDPKPNVEQIRGHVAFWKGVTVEA